MAKPKQGRRKPLELRWTSTEYLAVPVVKKGRTIESVQDFLINETMYASSGDEQFFHQIMSSPDLPK